MALQIILLSPLSELTLKLLKRVEQVEKYILKFFIVPLSIFGVF